MNSKTQTRRLLLLGRESCHLLVDAGLALGSAELGLLLEALGRLLAVGLHVLGVGAAGIASYTFCQASSLYY